MDPWVVFPSVIAIAIIFVVVPVALGTWTAYRGPKALRCPEDGSAARIRVNAGRAALADVSGVHLRCIAACSLWPARANCRENCLREPMHDLPSRV